MKGFLDESRASPLLMASLSPEHGIAIGVLQRGWTKKASKLQSFRIWSWKWQGFPVWEELGNSFDLLDNASLFFSGSLGYMMLHSWNFEGQLHHAVKNIWTQPLPGQFSSWSNSLKWVRHHDSNIREPPLNPNTSVWSPDDFVLSPISPISIKWH